VTAGDPEVSGDTPTPIHDLPGESSGQTPEPYPPPSPSLAQAQKQLTRIRNAAMEALGMLQWR